MAGAADGAARAAGLSDAEKVCTLAAGVFFLTALLTGVWKWRQMASSKSGSAHKCVSSCGHSNCLRVLPIPAFSLRRRRPASHPPTGARLVLTPVVCDSPSH